MKSFNMVTRDIPACRKVCGFTSHSSANACNKCDRRFSMINGIPDFSDGYGRFEHWSLRTKESNYSAAMDWLRATTPEERLLLEKKNGTRYSELHRLKYFDVVRQSVIETIVTPQINISRVISLIN